MFSIDGVVKKQNVRFWSNESPMKHSQTVLNIPGAMTGCEILNEFVIDLF